MGADESSRRIKFAYQMEHWSYEGGKALLTKSGTFSASRDLII